MVYTFCFDPPRAPLAFLVLTHVCRQLRAEFRPIYLHAVWMSYRYVLKFLSDFHGTATKISANITIDLFDLCLQTSPKEEDLLPLLRQLSKSTGLQVRFRTLVAGRKGAGLVGLSALLNACLDKMHDYTPEWRAQVYGRLSRIVARKSSKRVVVYVTRHQGPVLWMLGLDGGVNWKAIVKHERAVRA